MIPSFGGFVIFYYGAFGVESCLALCSRVLSVLFSTVIALLGEERAGLCASRAFVVILHAGLVQSCFCAKR